MNTRALKVARFCHLTGLNAGLLRLQAVILRPYIRAINYHDVPSFHAERFEEQLRFYASHFVPVGLSELLELQSGRWPHERPGLILSFDDGFRSHAEVVAPLLEKHGLVGWFFLPVEFIDTPPCRQEEYARDHSIQAFKEPEIDRLAMTWQDARRLDRTHVIGCHTMTHERLSALLTRQQLAIEIGGAKRRMEAELGHEVMVFAWVGGEEWSYSSEAARAIREAGFRISFMTNNAVIRPKANLLQLQRTNVEARYPIPLVRFQLSGLLDALYLAKRRRVNRCTALSGP